MDRTQTNGTGAAKKVRDLLYDCFGDIYALEDIAKNLGKSPFTVHTVQAIVSAFSGAILGRLTKCNRLLGGHGAICETAKAAYSLRALDELAHSFYDGGDGYCMPPRTAGMAMRAFIIEAGRSIERAEMALGAACGTAGFLNDPFDEAREPVNTFACHG